MHRFLPKIRRVPCTSMSKSQSLKTYYGIETGEPPAAPAPQPTLDEWTTDKSLHALLKASNELMDGIRDLYADRQSLVYNHHQELVNASETVGHMRHGIEALRPNREALEVQLKEMQAKRAMPPVYIASDADASIPWVRDVAPIAELPLKLRYMLDQNQLAEAVALFDTYKPTIHAWAQAGVHGAEELGKDCEYILKEAHGT